MSIPPETAMVAACVKWVDLRPELDPRTGLPTPSRHSWGFSEADRAAVEVALQLAEAAGTTTVVVCAGPTEALGTLSQLAASGPSRAVLVQRPSDSPAGTSGVALAGALGPQGLGVSTVVCGDMSYGRGSGTVPALIAHHLGFAQALGLIEVEPTGGGLRAVRRLDGARREVIALEGPAVISVEGSVARLRRAALDETLSDGGDRIEVVRSAGPAPAVNPGRLVPWRPPPRSVPAPRDPDAFDRVLELTGALTDRTPPRTIEAAPPEAASVILDQLRSWGYLDDERR